MDELIWKIIFMVFWISNGIIRMPHNISYKKTLKIKSIKIKREKSLVFIVAIGMIIVPLIYVFTHWLDSFNMDLPESVRWIGVVCFGFGAILFWWVHKILGKNWSPVLEIRKEHKLITQGPYKYVRHPMYTQIWIWVICQWLVLSNWIVGVVGILTWSILFFIRIAEEEKMMTEHFGQEYSGYSKKIKKIILGIY